MTVAASTRTRVVASACAWVAASVGLGAAIALAAQDFNAELRPYCSYQPDWAVFKQGTERVHHTTGGATRDAFMILMPDVKRPTKSYPSIQLKKGDRLRLYACGCVQHGGSGKTWKRYVDPSGPNSDRLYHGVVVVPGMLRIVPPPDATPSTGCCARSPTIQGAFRLQDWIAAQDRGFRFYADANFDLTLGYEDDGHGDNGYWGHDDGVNDQCRGVGGAAVRVIIDRAQQ